MEEALSKVPQYQHGGIVPGGALPGYTPLDGTSVGNVYYSTTTSTANSYNAADITTSNTTAEEYP